MTGKCLFLISAKIFPGSALIVACILSSPQLAHAQTGEQCWETTPGKPVMLADLKTRTVTGNRNFLQVNASPDAILASEFYFAPAEEKIKRRGDMSALPESSLSSFKIDPDMLFANTDGSRTLIKLPDVAEIAAIAEADSDVRIVSSLAVEPTRDWLNFGRQYKFRETRPKAFNSILSVPDPVYAENGSAIMQPLPLDGGLPPVIGFDAAHSRALIKILHKSAGSHIWRPCVGTHLGGGKVLTARHCLNDDFIFPVRRAIC